MKKKLKEILITDLELLFKKLRKVLKRDKAKLNDLNLIEAQYYEFKAKKYRNTISFDNYNMSISKIREQLLSVIDSINVNHAKKGYKDFSDGLDLIKKIANQFSNHSDYFIKASRDIQFYADDNILTQLGINKVSPPTRIRIENFVLEMRNLDVEVRNNAIYNEKKLKKLTTKLAVDKYNDLKFVLANGEKVEIELFSRELILGYNKILNYNKLILKAIKIELDKLSNNINHINEKDFKRIAEYLFLVQFLFKKTRKYYKVMRKLTKELRE